MILGKAINSGANLCFPLLCARSVVAKKEETFVRLFKERYQAYFANAKNKNIQTHIINQKQYERLQGLLDDARKKGAEVHVIQEGDSSSEKRIIYPHLLTKVGEDMEVMKQEIFGPVMPVLPYNSIDECIESINARPRPLALYVMSTNKDTVNKILKHTHSGGACVLTIRLCMSRWRMLRSVVSATLGIGHYHGEEGFRRLSKAKTVLTSKTWLPKNKFFLSYRDLMFYNLRKFLLR